MAKISPFEALRPQPQLAKQVASKPYDVLNSASASENAYIGFCSCAIVAVAKNTIKINRFFFMCIFRLLVYLIFCIDPSIHVL